MRPRFYIGTYDGPEVPMQVERPPVTSIPEPIARLAWNEYAPRFPGQEFEHFFHQRGGFGAVEIIHLLADRIERLEDERTRERSNG